MRLDKIAKGRKEKVRCAIVVKNGKRRNIRKHRNSQKNIDLLEVINIYNIKEKRRAAFSFCRVFMKSFAV